MATALQLQANRINAQLSTGPASEDGKEAASRNALRHGILTSRLLLDHEDPAELDALVLELTDTLEPVGAVEMALVERIAISLWRQRRLVEAETAELQFDRRPAAIARSVGGLEETGLRWDSGPEILEPFDDERRVWCSAVLAEYESLDEMTLDTIRSEAPLIYAQISRDCDEDGDTPEAMIASRKDGLVGYLVELVSWCRRQVKAAEHRPRVLALAEQMRARKLILPLRQLEVIARYQSTLDNQLYKALRALREAQAWRRSNVQTPANDSE